MARKTGLSIRYKILLLLTLLPLTVLAVYLVVAINVFEEDKIAYIFESSSSVAQTLAAQTNSEMESVLTNTRPAIQEFLSYQRFDMISKGLFLSEGPAQWVTAFRLNEQGVYAPVDTLERNKGSFQTDWRQWSEAPQFLQELAGKNRVIAVPFKDDRLVIGERVRYAATETEPERSVLFVISAKAPGLMQVFRSPGQTANYLVNPAGTVLFGPRGSQGSALKEKVPLDFLVGDGQFQQGTEEVKDSGGQTMLLSYSLSQFGNLFAVSLVSKKTALKAVDVLIRKSLVFFALLICITVVVSLLASSGLTSALTDLFQATKKVAEGHFDIRVKVTSSDEVGSLAGSFNAMAEEVQRLMMETAEKARMESELKTAQTVQETLFPPTQAEISGLRVRGFYEPASECGGDWWHYCEVDGKVFLWIGDATGHGAPAALITSAAKSAATIIERLNVEPAQALSLLNRAVFDVSRGRIMMTFFLACYDPDRKTLTYSNASHEAPYLLKKSSQPLKKKDLIPLNEVNSPRLGQSKETEFKQTTVELGEGDRILFYTDGIPDIQSPGKEAWGEREFIKGILACSNQAETVNAAVDGLVATFQAYRQGASLVDDITFFMVEVGAKAG